MNKGITLIIYNYQHMYFLHIQTGKKQKRWFNTHTLIRFSLHSVFFYSRLNIKTRLNTFLQTKLYFVKFLRTFLSLSACFDTQELYKYLNGFAENEISMKIINKFRLSLKNIFSWNASAFTPHLHS